MANKFPSLGDFEIPGELLDLHEWMADSLIDSDTGVRCTLIYPDKWTECDNCLLDLATGRSANIYKDGGPVEFPAHTLCPRCQGDGRAQLPVTEEIRMRAYWTPKGWEELGFKVANPQGIGMCLGYMEDLPKVERANKILIDADMSELRRYECVREGEAYPWGFRHNRYFVQFVKRAGS